METALAVLGEHRFGAGRNVENLVFASCGSGVGAGVVLGGRLAVGRYSLGEVGHTIIDLTSRRTVEELASGIALERSLGIAGSSAEAGRVGAAPDDQKRVIAQLATTFGLCVCSLALCYMPDRIVVGGGCANAHPELLAAARREIERIADIQPLRPKDVLRTELGDDASLMGGYPFWAETQT